MPKTPDRTHKRHVREKATIDHLVQGVSKPTAPDEEHPEHSPPPLAACRSRSRSARSGILAKVAFRLFSGIPVYIETDSQR
jgi:hypothetical protein